MTDSTIIALDLGATKCAAGIIEYSHETKNFSCLQSCSVKLAETSSLPDLLEQLSAQLHMPFTSADAVCIGAAGQYNGMELHHLDGVYPYPMRFAEIAEKQQWPDYAIIHDYDTIICATFTSYMQNPDNLLRLNSCSPLLYRRRVALGLGTGLGMKDGVLLQNDDFWLGKNEIGHIGIIHPPLTDAVRLSQHQEFMRFLLAAQTHTHQQITFENILTGRGLVHLYQFLYPSAEMITPEMVGEAMLAGKAPALLDLLAWYLGLFIGSVQLMFMPEGGLWITGGVAQKHLEIFSQPSFNAGIEASPAYLHERQTYPLGVMKHPQHALIGAGYYAVQRLLNKVTYPSSSLP